MHAYGEVNLLDASCSPITLDGVNAVNSLWHELCDEDVSIKDQGLEQPAWRDWGGVLICIGGHTLTPIIDIFW